MIISIMVEALLVIAVALAIDMTFGDPKNRYHPTAWIGWGIATITIRARNNIHGRFGGIVIVLPVVVVTVVSVLAVLYLFDNVSAILLPEYVQILAYVLLVGVMLKTTIAIRGMKKHADAVLTSLNQDDISTARINLSMIVKRDTKELGKKHVISGVLESISENTVDGITGPLFYYAVFGLPGAFVYRVINTADSMIGYKTGMFRNMGWFAARCDTILNYIPSRLTGLVMVVAAGILGCDWRNSYRTMMQDGGLTASRNAGYPMAALAGALQTRFEKIGHYSLGRDIVPLTTDHVNTAISIMKLTSVLFAVLISIPIVVVLFIVGWWGYV